MLGRIFKCPIISQTLLTQIRSVHRITHKYFIHDKNTFSTTMAVRRFLTRRTSSNGSLQNVLIQHRQMSHLDVNTKVKNNVIIYKNDRSLYFRNAGLFGLGQIFGWTLLAFYTYKPSFWDIFNTDIKFKEYFSNHLLRLNLFLFSIIAGPFMFFFTYVLCSRTVKYIILNKGGKTLSITTYHMLRNKSNFNVPVGVVRNVSDRTLGRVLALKIKGAVEPTRPCQ
ncbi:PREDICTED: uncharacterized protein LOC105560863 isoform X2 [Vollenhovia emeryi]|uniref:uncharacterized protein LOC105560863 isoform X2 n=1 Tax=Vollenhovia emeryi TaxID=411798 RepID=UPI0005F4E58C|nr:PREDICTED: uncharacterized protein LOC105560863 isoform X2 [Vollenhovia emeryi]